MDKVPHGHLFPFPVVIISSNLLFSDEVFYRIFYTSIISMSNEL